MHNLNSMKKEPYDKKKGTQEWLDKFKQQLGDLEATSSEMHPVRKKLYVNATKAMIADLEQQLKEMQ